MVRLKKSKSQKLILVNVGNDSVTDCQLRSFFPIENTLKFGGEMLASNYFLHLLEQVTDRVCYSRPPHSVTLPPDCHLFILGLLGLALKEMMGLRHRTWLPYRTVL